MKADRLERDAAIVALSDVLKKEKDTGGSEDVNEMLEE